MNFYDPLVQFSVNAIITVLGIALTVFVTIWVYRRQQTKTEFSYDVISDAPIASINERALDKVELFINNKPVKDAQSCDLGFGIQDVTL